MIFIEGEGPYSRCMNSCVGENEPDDCLYDDDDGLGTIWRWRLTGNKIKGFSLFTSHGYTECSWFGAEIWIDAYTKDDGTEVDGYYRKRPSCWD